MNRSKQLSNVAFGGAWSEQIADDEALAAALDRIDRAVEDTVYEDLRGFGEVAGAVSLAASEHPKGALLAQAWRRGLDFPNAGLRSAELKRVALALRAGVGVRVRGKA